MKKKIRKNYEGKITGKKFGKKIREIIVRPDMVSSEHMTLSLPVKKDPLGRILRNFRYACAEHTSVLFSIFSSYLPLPRHFIFIIRVL